jgi:hypothetical protein
MRKPLGNINRMDAAGVGQEVFNLPRTPDGK